MAVCPVNLCAWLPAAKTRYFWPFTSHANVKPFRHLWSVFSGFPGKPQLWNTAVHRCTDATLLVTLFRRYLTGYWPDNSPAAIIIDTAAAYSARKALPRFLNEIKRKLRLVKLYFTKIHVVHFTYSVQFTLYHLLIHSFIINNNSFTSFTDNYSPLND